MITQDELFGLLHGVIHPELHSDIVSLGMVEELTITEQQIQFTLRFRRPRDPFTNAIKRRCEELIGQHYPLYAQHILIFIKEGEPHKSAPQPAEPFGSKGEGGYILAISSAKGGVGKSTVTAHLAMALSAAGYRVGILDADIYGPSQPMLFGVENYQPAGVERDGREWIIPAEKWGVQIMSIGFFINPNDALIWRGAMATNALRQMIRQTLWDNLDFLLIDLPPGTGDVHLSVIHEMKVNGALIVTTPQPIALADVVRGIAMFRNEKIAIPVLGLVDNMAWFTPKELPQNRYYIFGKGGTQTLAQSTGLPLLAAIPLIQSNEDEKGAALESITTQDPVNNIYNTLKDSVIELSGVGKPKTKES